MIRSVSCHRVCLRHRILDCSLLICTETDFSVSGSPHYNSFWNASFSSNTHAEMCLLCFRAVPCYARGRCPECQTCPTCCKTTRIPGICTWEVECGVFSPAILRLFILKSPVIVARALISGVDLDSLCDKFHKRRQDGDLADILVIISAYM